MKKNQLRWTLFGSNSWSRDLPYERRLVFMKLLKQYELLGVEPPYAEIRFETLSLTHEQVREKLESLKTHTTKCAPLIDTLMIDDVGNDE